MNFSICFIKVITIVSATSINMSRVWKAAEPSPVLDKFCDLSLDAQRVMAALYTDFHQKRADLKATKTQYSCISDLHVLSNSNLTHNLS